MTPLLLCAVVALAQVAVQPAPRANRDTVARRSAAAARLDTIYVAVQAPPPTVNVQSPAPTVVVEAPSEWPTILVGLVGLVLVGFQGLIMLRQARIMARQTGAMETQSTLLAKQTALGEQQATWRRDEAIGTFYRMAFDLAEEFRKANVGSSTRIPANYDTHPRQVLRQASAVFAPLGNAFVLAVNAAGMQLDEYFSAVQNYNEPFDLGLQPGGAVWIDNLEFYNTLQSLRGSVGGYLDLANRQIADELRWKYPDGKQYQFQRDCAKPVAMREAARD